MEQAKIEPDRKRPKTGGRKKGSLNKATRDIRALAQPYGPEALKTLVGIMRAGESDVARRAAATEVLDRAYGKAAQSIEVSGEISVAHVLDAARERLKHARG